MAAYSSRGGFRSSLSHVSDIVGLLDPNVGR